MQTNCYSIRSAVTKNKYFAQGELKVYVIRIFHIVLNHFLLCHCHAIVAIQVFHCSEEEKETMVSKRVWSRANYQKEAAEFEGY